MLIYISLYGHSDYVDTFAPLGCRSFLFSFASHRSALDGLKRLEKYDDKFNILIDSGAFSFWNTGKDIGREEYLKFIEKVKSQHNQEIYFINLDVIPQQKGMSPTQDQIKAACEKGIENYFYFKEKGHLTVHTFHQFDHWEYLDIILNECNDLNYIGVSPANDQTLTDRNKFLQTCYKIIDNRTRTHILGLTAKNTLEMFPSYSADSTTWLNGKKYGEIFDYRKMVKIPKTKISQTNILDYNFEKISCTPILYFLHLEKYITKLWEMRGIKWN